MKRAWRSPNVQRLWRAVNLIAAALLLFTIAADILADARCDRPPTARASGGFVTSTQGRPTGDDPCGSSCVPDCFCCSTLSTGPATLSLESSGPAVLIEPCDAVAFRAGVYPLPYRPPLGASLS